MASSHCKEADQLVSQATQCSWTLKRPARATLFGDRVNQSPQKGKYALCLNLKPFDSISEFTIKIIYLFVFTGDNAVKVMTSRITLGSKGVNVQ